MTPTVNDMREALSEAHCDDGTSLSHVHTSQGQPTLVLSLNGSDYPKVKYMTQILDELRQPGFSLSYSNVHLPDIDRMVKTCSGELQLCRDGVDGASLAARQLRLALPLDARGRDMDLAGAVGLGEWMRKNTDGAQAQAVVALLVEVVEVLSGAGVWHPLHLEDFVVVQEGPTGGLRLALMGGWLQARRYGDAVALRSLEPVSSVDGADSSREALKADDELQGCRMGMLIQQLLGAHTRSKLRCAEGSEQVCSRAMAAMAADPRVSSAGSGSGHGPDECGSVRGASLGGMSDSSCGCSTSSWHGSPESCAASDMLPHSTCGSEKRCGSESSSDDVTPEPMCCVQCPIGTHSGGVCGAVAWLGGWLGRRAVPAATTAAFATLAVAAASATVAVVAVASVIAWAHHRRAEAHA